MITAVLGLQFGDEGKGKITDFLSGEHSTVVRFNGGSNAGHTVVTESGTFKFHLVPSGALRCRNIILGNGMVIDPISLIEEIEKLQQVKKDLNIRISLMAHVVTPMHKYLDRAEEEVRSKLSIGTTAQGIGPTYEDKYARTGIRMGDLSSIEILRSKVETIYSMKRALLEGSEFESRERREEMVRQLNSAYERIRPYLDYTEITINRLYREGESILFEGAQGAMLDIDFGMYPFVTSSNTIAGALSLGAGLSFRKVDRVVGVAKAYVSKVGAGPFPTEILGEEAERLRKLGNEYGTTTGRPRRVGWLDIPMLRYSTMMNDVDVIAMTRLDTLGQLGRIKVCYQYASDSGPVDVIPRNLEDVQGIRPLYKEFTGWGPLDAQTLNAVVEKGYYALPQGMREYVEYVEKVLGIPVEIISLGERREYTIRKGSMKVSRVTG